MENNNLKNRHRRLLTRATFLPVLLVTVAGILLSAYLVRISQLEGYLQETDSTIRTVRRTQQLLGSMEANYNSFLATNRERFLGRYLRARDEVPERFSELEEIVERTGGLSQFSELKTALLAWIDHAEHILELDLTQRSALFSSQSFQEEGNLNLQKLDKAFEDFTNRQIRLRESQIENAIEVRSLGLYLGLGLLLAGGTFLSWYFRRELSFAFGRYERQTKILYEGRSALRKTLLEKHQAEQARDEFLKVASHELNTPIQSLRLSTELLQREIHRSPNTSINPERLSKHLEREVAGINRLTQLITAMLDVGLLNKGAPKIAPAELHLTELIEKVIYDLRFLIQGSGSRMSLELSEISYQFWDAQMLSQIIECLLSNAVKYGRGRLITVRTREDGDSAWIEVEDQGIGVRPEAREKIFERFERDICSNEVSGLGMGLFIAKNFVDAHAGKIWVEDTSGNTGAKFVVELPKREILKTLTA